MKPNKTRKHFIICLTGVYVRVCLDHICGMFGLPFLVGQHNRAGKSAWSQGPA